MWLIVGAGLSGAVMAERLATLGYQVKVIDKRNHIGGNCYDYVDPETGIRLNKYGAHLFHTDDAEVWEYINRFCRWVRWEHKVLSKVENKLVPIPVNITTVNMLIDGMHIKDSDGMQEWLNQNVLKYDSSRGHDSSSRGHDSSSRGITNSEEMALSRVGPVLYHKMFKPYTWKQWNKDPSQLDPSVLGRIPVRDNFDSRYFTDKYQGLPEMGYTYFFEKLLGHSNIKVDLEVDFFNLTREDLNQYQGIIYTGPIDQFFKSTGFWTDMIEAGLGARDEAGLGDGAGVMSELDDLEYRSIDFKVQRFMGMGYYQPNSVINYPELEYPYTRVVEYKHFPGSCDVGNMNTVIVSESTNDHGEPYYPVPTQRNMDLYAKYERLADHLSAVYPIHFLGRLATYKYYNMDQAIRAALNMIGDKFTNDID